MSATITANIANAARVARQIGQELEERHRSARRSSVREFSTLDMDFDELMADVGRLARAVAMLANVVASQEERIAKEDRT